ncbi:MAG: hypothetical protein AB3N18_10300 [Allomuricauda sp.]
MKLRVLFLAVFVIGLNGSMNGQLNKYKYIIVPKQFDAFKTQNRYQTSTTIKHLFTKNGFNAVYDDALPDDLANNRCLGLLVDLEDNSSLFATKTAIVLQDCQLNEVFRSIEGKSKIKEYKKAYREALNDAFITFSGLNYTYTPKIEEKQEAKEEPIIVSFKNDVKSLEEKPVEEVIVQEATTENQTYKSVKPVESNYVKAEKSKEPLAEGLLYAQPIENGYQLVDSTPKVVMKLMKTSVADIFLVNHNGRSGMLTNQEGKWILEYADDGGKKAKELKIKF